MKDMGKHHFIIATVLLSLVSAVHSLTRCPAKGLLRSYYCPRSYDSPDQTRCCSWYGSPSCCLPGGLFCSEHQGGHVRDYCPGPYDDKDNRVCCIINNKAKCCQVHLRTETTVGLIAAAILFFAMGILLCCCWSKCPLAQRRKRRQMQTSDVPYPGTHPPLTQSSQGDHNNAN